MDPKARNSIDIDTLCHKAKEIRKHVVRMVARHGQGYVQQGLGAADLFTVLYFSELHLDGNDLERDRCILSTAHNSAVFHATLAVRGLIETSRLDSYCQDGSQLEINVSERMGASVEATCGSLGQGLSVAVGMALSARRRESRARYHVILGDGEMQEGQVWEAAMCAASYSLDNLCLTIDMNNMQAEGHIDSVLNMEPVADKWTAFGWHTISCDGNSIEALMQAYDEARDVKEKPSVIIAGTLVGSGVPFLEGKLSHNMVLPKDVAEQALNFLEA
ncbi:transketolase [Pelagibius sp. Alg239-R121]|uniref:transketolase n=1 Tax=Pelagibius sp. Alg239-R121 TaxID=2993448 RepID=UPI0024A6CD39|nr:transketolase [Pelagibius sp. Alg239-R121]